MRLLTAALIAFLLWPAPVAAQGRTACMPRDGLLTQLEKKYGETPAAIGIANGALVELLTSKDGVTWTIIITSPDGTSCFVGSGDDWQNLEPASPPVKGTAS